MKNSNQIFEYVLFLTLSFVLASAFAQIKRTASGVITLTRTEILRLFT